MEAKTIDEIKDIRDKAEAIRLYAIQAKDVELESLAGEIKVRASRRCGELSKELEKAKPDKGHGNIISDKSMLKKEVLKQAGLAIPTAYRCEIIASVPKKKFEEYIDDKKKKNQPVYAKEILRMVPKEEVRKKELRISSKKNVDNY